MQNTLPADEFCLINIPHEKISYGIINDHLHSRFMDILSGETLECLEYLDQKDLKGIPSYSATDIIGNERLLRTVL
jgi:hypothetical protein